MCSAYDDPSAWDEDLSAIFTDNELVKRDTDIYYALKDLDIDLDIQVTYPPLVKEEDLIEYE